MRVHTNLLKCRGCGTCTLTCQNNAFKKIKTKQYVIDQEKCKECLNCVKACPFNAIYVLENMKE